MSSNITKEQFLKEAIDVHGEKYDYSISNYINYITKIKILCKEHKHIFEQKPKNHSKGKTFCPKCIKQKCTVVTTELFIERANKIHNNEYDYSLAKYVNSITDIIIICKIHGPYTCKISNHLQGTKCPHCNGTPISNTLEFIKKAIKIHGDRYDYSNVDYKKCFINVCIRCFIHGDFLQSPSNHLSGHQCQKCSSIKYSTESFIQKAKKIHGDIYDYSLVDFVNIDTHITIICKEHGRFETTGKTHLKGSICRKCSIHKYSMMKRSNIDEFIEKSRKIHGDRYDYSKGEYINTRTKIDIVCKEHGIFSQLPKCHILGKGCAKCSPNGYSKMGIYWMNFLSSFYKINIQHAENGGEYCIPNTNYKVDGFCKENNTVYEFHGTEYHGDPKVCKAEDYSYFGISYGELYKKTIQKEVKIKELGYNYIIIWERNWKLLLKIVKKIQKKFLSISKLNTG